MSNLHRSGRPLEDTQWVKDVIRRARTRQVELGRFAPAPAKGIEAGQASAPTLFPLALALGLIHGASPALADRATQLLSAAGMTQQRALACLRRDYGVGWR